MCSGSVMGLVLISILMGLISPSARAADAPRAPTPDPVTGGERERPEAPYLHLPVFLHYRKPRVDKQHFSPVRANSQKPLPERVRKLLLSEPRRRLKARARPSGPVTVTCNAGEMRVRVHTANLGASGERVHVRLGTCGVSRSTERGVLFRSELHQCGTQRQVPVPASAPARPHSCTAWSLRFPQSLSALPELHLWLNLHKICTCTGLRPDIQSSDCLVLTLQKYEL